MLSLCVGHLGHRSPPEPNDSPTTTKRKMGTALLGDAFLISSLFWDSRSPKCHLSWQVQRGYNVRRGNGEESSLETGGRRERGRAGWREGKRKSLDHEVQDPGSPGLSVLAPRPPPGGRHGAQTCRLTWSK